MATALDADTLRSYNQTTAKVLPLTVGPTLAEAATAFLNRRDRRVVPEKPRSM